jgi:hypothetical protein
MSVPADNSAAPIMSPQLRQLCAESDYTLLYVIRGSW